MHVCVSGYDSIYTVCSIELKFGMYVIVHNRMYCIDFGECQLHKLAFTCNQKTFLPKIT